MQQKPKIPGTKKLYDQTHPALNPTSPPPPTSSASSTPLLSLLIPAYREEENLKILLPQLREALVHLDVTYEVLIVDTCPPLDQTPNLCEEEGRVWEAKKNQGHEEAAVLEPQKPQGSALRHLPRSPTNSYGDAIRTGIREARGQFLLVMDADGSHTPAFIPTLWNEAKSGAYDVVIASRYVKGGDTENPISLIWMSRALNFIYSFVLGLRCKDVSNSFKIYRLDQLKTLHLKCHHFDIVEEILVRLFVSQRNLRVKEVPFVFKKRMFGSTKRQLTVFILFFSLTLMRLLYLKIGMKLHR